MRTEPFLNRCVPKNLQWSLQPASALTSFPLVELSSSGSRPSSSFQPVSSGGGPTLSTILNAYERQKYSSGEIRFPKVGPQSVLEQLETHSDPSLSPLQLALHHQRDLVLFLEQSHEAAQELHSLYPRAVQRCLDPSIHQSMQKNVSNALADTFSRRFESCDLTYSSSHWSVCDLELLTRIPVEKINDYLSSRQQAYPILKSEPHTLKRSIRGRDHVLNVYFSPSINMSFCKYMVQKHSNPCPYYLAPCDSVLLSSGFMEKIKQWPLASQLKWFDSTFGKHQPVESEGVIRVPSQHVQGVVLYPTFTMEGH